MIATSSIFAKGNLLWPKALVVGAIASLLSVSFATAQNNVVNYANAINQQGTVISSATQQRNSTTRSRVQPNARTVSQPITNPATQPNQPMISQPTPGGNTYFDQGSVGGCGGCDAGGCGGGCSTGCGGCGLGGGCGGGLFGGLIKPSDHCFDGFISPMTNPVFFEDPRALTEARLIFFRHQVPQAAGSGSVRLLAMQLRARLSDNVSLIATKDGYIFSSNPLVQDGWADLSAGLKFNLIRDVANQRLLSGGFTYELPTGEADPFQGNGDGEVHLFLTGGQQIGCNMHWLSAIGYRLPVNGTDESSSMYWSNHLDRRIGQSLYVFGETNWFHWLQPGQDGPLPGIEGLDVINFGNPDVAGNDIVTQAFGVKYKPSRNNELGFAFEFPLTQRRDIIDNRLTVDWIIRY